MSDETRPNPGQWKKGQSGNPAGRPRGSRNRGALAMELMLDGESGEITRTAIEQAKGGHPVALRLCLQRILPAPRGRRIEIDMPATDTPAAAAAALDAAIQAMAAGEITPDEAETVSRLIEAKRRALETVDLEARLARIENRLGLAP